MSEDRRPPKSTSGSAEREARSLIAPLEPFDVEAELADLTGEPEWSGNDRNARTLAKTPSFRVVLVALKSGARVGEDEAHGPMSVHVLRGAVQVSRSAESSPLAAGALAVLDVGGPWHVEATADSAILLTIAWPEERALV